ncbi:hypothetical protein V1289_003412 [Bradyrhizobium sp. AZCC 2289]
MPRPRARMNTGWSGAWSDIDRLRVVESPPGLSFERTTSPSCNPQAAGPGNGAVPAAQPLRDVLA